MYLRPFFDQLRRTCWHRHKLPTADVGCDDLTASIPIGPEHICIYIQYQIVNVNQLQQTREKEGGMKSGEEDEHMFFSFFLLLTSNVVLSEMLLSVE